MKKKIFASILSVMLILSIAIPFAIFAGAVTTLENDKFLQVKKNGYYKISATGEGYITATAKTTGSSSYSYASISFDVLNSKKKEFVDYTSDDSVWSYVYGKKTTTDKTDIIPVSKGTYYIKVSDISLDDGGKAFIKYTFKATKATTNYTASKAINLAASKKVGIYQTPSNNFDRWFKIKLTKAQKVTFSGTNLNDYDFNVYDTEGNKIKVEKNKTPKLAEGTYYVVVFAEDYAFGAASYKTIMWK